MVGRKGGRSAGGGRVSGYNAVSAQDIRTLKHSCVRNVHWTKPLTVPALVLSFAMAAIFVVMLWK